MYLEIARASLYRWGVMARYPPGMQRWLARLLLLVGWIFLFVGAVALLGHILRPGEASTPELGRYGGWILDGLTISAGVAVLFIRRWLLTRMTS
jgi:hypothetical protein